MITEFLECLFRPNEKMTDFQMRKTGIITAAVGIILIIVPYLVFVIGNNKSQSQQFLPMMIFIVGIFYGLGIHRAIWGNTSRSSLYICWGKGLASVVATIVSIVLSFFIVGFFAACINRIVK